MGDTKSDWIASFFDQIESQVQFGDTKASLLVAGDSILLIVSGGLIEFVSGCKGNDFALSCMVPSVSLGLAVFAAACLVVALACSLWAARPASKHDDPSRELFLFSYIARIEFEEFARQFTDADEESLIQEALMTIHGKAHLARHKFRFLKYAVYATLASLGLMVASLAFAFLP